MRSRLILIPVSILLTAAGGMALCIPLHWNPHPLELSLAAFAVVLSSLSALAPLWIARHGNQLNLSQAALVATMLHLFVVVALAAIAILGHFPLHSAFLIWLSAFYWMTLIALVMVAVRMIKSAPQNTSTAAAAGAHKA